MYSMVFFEAFFVFVFGTIMGSFLNVVLIRGNTGRSIGGRSACMSCGTQLTWLDLIPILSYLWLRGRCRMCGSSISMQYPFVELSSGVLALTALFFAGTMLEMVYLYTLFVVLLFISVYDIRHTIIPDTAVVCVGVLACCFHFFIQKALSMEMLLVLFLSACLAAFPFFLLWVFSRGRAMGLGDAKLAFAFGMFFAPLESIAFVWLSFVLGGIAALALMLMRALVHTRYLKVYAPTVTIHSEIPFGPFLVVAFFLVLFFGVDIYTILNWFSL